MLAVKSHFVDLSRYSLLSRMFSSSVSTSCFAVAFLCQHFAVHNPLSCGVGGPGGPRRYLLTQHICITTCSSTIEFGADSTCLLFYFVIVGDKIVSWYFKYIRLQISGCTGALGCSTHVIVLGGSWAVGWWRNSWLAQVVAFK